MKQRVFLGTSSGGDGLYVAWFDVDLGQLSEPKKVASLPKPSWVRFAGNGSLLVSTQPSDSGAHGQLTACAVSPDGQLTEQSKASTRGYNPVAFDERDGVVVAVNYLSGSAASFQMSPTGKLTEESLLTFEAAEHGPDLKRQDHSYAHDAVFSPEGNFVFVNDLGCDRIRILKVNRPEGTLESHTEWHSDPGAGPRHVTLHPNGRWVYNINEMGCSIDHLLWDAGAGTLTRLSSISTLPEGASKVDVRACEIIFGRAHRFLYAANRVHEDFVVYAVADDGSLTEIQRVPNPGKEARHIAIDTTGQYLLAANQFTNEVLVFPIDQATGLLQPTVSNVPINSPSCILFG